MSSDLAKPGIRDTITSPRQLWSSTKIAAAIAAAVDPTMKPPEAFAPAGSYPVTYGGSGVQQGDTYRIASAGTMGAVTVNTEDLLIALVDTPAQVDANWMVAESNRDQATETVKGVAEIATQAEADAGTNDTNIMTPLKTATAPVRAHDIDPGAGPHTGGLPEASSEFDDSTGHAHTGAAGNGTVVAHSDTSGQGTDDHHNEAHQLDPSGGPHTGTTPEASVVFDGAGHDHSGGAGGKAVAHSDTSGKTTDDHHAKQHALGAAADHTSATLAELNTLVSDATLDDDDDPRPADEIITTTGPTTMPVGAVADGQALVRSGGNVVGAPLKNDFQLSWDDVSTLANDYVVAARFIFRGTGVIGTPASMKVAVVMSGANTGDIKIFDVTNSLQIVEKTGISNTTVAVVDLGALSNLPAAEAVFEVQIRVPAVGAVNINVFSLGVFF